MGLGQGEHRALSMCHTDSPIGWYTGPGTTLWTASTNLEEDIGALMFGMGDRPAREVLGETNSRSMRRCGTVVYCNALYT